jgi:hypothetical protein
LPTSVVEPKVPVLVPPESENDTPSPPVVMVLPAASLACKVTVSVAPETSVLAFPATVTTDVAVVARPGDTVMVGNADVTLTVLIVAAIVSAVPTVTPVKVAV